MNFVIKRLLATNYYTFTFSIFGGSLLNINVHSTTNPPCTRSLLYRGVPVSYNANDEATSQKRPRDHREFLDKWPMTTWSLVSVTATGNELHRLCISCLHRSSLPITGVQIDWHL